MTRLSFTKENRNDMLFGAAMMFIVLAYLPRPQDIIEDYTDAANQSQGA